MGQGSIVVGTDNRLLDFSLLFPPLPDGEIYVGLSGGIESTAVLHLVHDQYRNHDIIPCTVKHKDRRMWEYDNAYKIASLYGLGHVHTESHSLRLKTKFRTPLEYFNQENYLFDSVRKNNPRFVAGFTGKNTTTLDPEIITVKQQHTFRVLFKVHRPLLQCDKHHTVDIFYKLGIEDTLQHTHSCQVNDRIHCGQCHACWERIDAFDRLGKKDPAIYSDDYDKLVEQVRRFFKIRWPRR